MCLPIQLRANRKDRSSLAITSTTSSSLPPSRLSPSLSTLSQNGSPTSSSPSSSYSSSSSSSSPKSCALRVVRKWSEANPAQPGQQQPKHFCSPERERVYYQKSTNKKRKKEDALALGTKKTLALQHRPSKLVNSRSPTFCSEFHLWNSDFVQTSL